MKRIKKCQERSAECKVLYYFSITIDTLTDKVFELGLHFHCVGFTLPVVLLLCSPIILLTANHFMESCTLFFCLCHFFKEYLIRLETVLGKM